MHSVIPDMWQRLRGLFCYLAVLSKWWNIYIIYKYPSRVQLRAIITLGSLHIYSVTSQAGIYVSSL